MFRDGRARRRPSDRCGLRHAPAVHGHAPEAFAHPGLDGSRDDADDRARSRGTGDQSRGAATGQRRTAGRHCARRGAPRTLPANPRGPTVKRLRNGTSNSGRSSSTVGVSARISTRAQSPCSNRRARPSQRLRRRRSRLQPRPRSLRPRSFPRRRSTGTITITAEATTRVEPGMARGRERQERRVSAASGRRQNRHPPGAICSRCWQSQRESELRRPGHVVSDVAGCHELDLDDAFSPVFARCGHRPRVRQGVARKDGNAQSDRQARDPGFGPRPIRQEPAAIRRYRRGCS